MNIKEAKVLITGGTSGIGKEIANLLHQKGAQVVICGRDKQRLDNAVNEIGVIGYKADISKEDEVKSLFDFANKQMGGLNVVVNNAGIGLHKDLVDTGVEEFTKIWEVNTRGAFLVGREAARHFIKANTGNIINISSSSGKRGYAGGTSYVASKFAFSGMTECWRAELRKYNVRVMQINPSEVITNFFEKMGAGQTESDSKLKPSEIAHVALAMLEMNDVGFITEASVWATNPKS